MSPQLSARTLCSCRQPASFASFYADPKDAVFKALGVQ